MDISENCPHQRSTVGHTQGPCHRLLAKRTLLKTALPSTPASSKGRATTLGRNHAGADEPSLLKTGAPLSETATIRLDNSVSPPDAKVHEGSVHDDSERVFRSAPTHVQFRRDSLAATFVYFDRPRVILLSAAQSDSLRTPNGQGRAQGETQRLPIRARRQHEKPSHRFLRR